ncbi:MAG TPA: hypothetical protein VN179_03115, partial [Solirubrobacterales bacterium]|nr:hypothetical protein [Solirubrobacterales bacterium]
MTLGPKRIQLFLALVASAVALAGLAAPSAAVAGGAVYTMHREGLRVRLEVRGEEIISTDVWTRHRCTDGYEGGAALHLGGPGQEIPLNRSGAF